MYSLSDRKNRGWLTYLSESVLMICQKSESVIRTAVCLNKLASTSLLLEIVHEVLDAFHGKELFTELHEHMFDNPPLDNHYIGTSCEECCRKLH